MTTQQSLASTVLRRARRQTSKETDSKENKKRTDSSRKQAFHFVPPFLTAQEPHRLPN